MDDQASFEPEFHSESTMDVDGPLNDQYTGAFFPRAQNFVVAGGKFTSITNITHAALNVPSDFRMIPMGDLDLREEIRQRHRSGVVYRGEGRASVRRVYSARIYGSDSKMTVAVYQGKNAEEEWREDISQYSWLLHPNLVQLFATATSAGIHAAVFYGDLMPVENLVDKYRGCHQSTVHLYHYFGTKFSDVDRYMYSAFGAYLVSSECTMWIRCSTGQLCVDLTPSTSDRIVLCDTMGGLEYLPFSFAPSSSEPPGESQIIGTTPLETYHKICYNYLSHSRTIPISAETSVQPGAIISCKAGTGNSHSTVIARVPGKMFLEYGWFGAYTELLVLGDGWARVNSSNIRDDQIRRTIIHNFRFPRLSGDWLAQANYIFNRLGITSNYDDYGYLFLCPLQDLQPKVPFNFGAPACAAYWSLHPSGAERLSVEEAEELGFPRLELKMEVYTGVRQFHEGKGCYPYSQDAVRMRGYSLYQVSSERDGPFAHVQDLNEDSAHALNATPQESNLGVDPSLARENFHPGELEPSRTWKIIMSVQFLFILTLSVLYLYDSLHSHISTW
ncbi:hypothetical protein DFH09DRAFT_1276322 [Mycena vulgaris]|nr:hypothetical protein DFH09DRAFT_1276322 [Mycena vulgaris]